ncbi:MAG: hypothetical protein L0228_00405 [Planctomycetes bacterium]|nr:hypothetical protein [Planctomycetota bacterium]
MRSTLRIAACILLMTMLAATLSAATNAGNLEWRRGRVAGVESAAADDPPASLGARLRLDPSPPSPVSTARATQLNPLRGPRRHVDSSLRTVAFEDERGPQFGNNASSGSPYRSVIVERDDDVRSAQLSSGAPDGSPSTPAAPGATDSGAQPIDELRSPVIDTSTELPPLEEPPIQDLETPPIPDDTRTQPGIEQRQPLQPQPRQPSTEFQPRVPPTRGGIGAELPPAPSLSEETIEAEREKAEEACEQGFEDLRNKTIDKLSLVISVTGEEGSDFPFECTLDEALHGGRCWEQTTYMWKASALCHKPLYFEDEQLERYGHSFSPCFQPFISGAHFFTRPFVLPYCTGVEPPCECIYALGHYRPGNCAPYMCNPIPISPRGALFQAGAVVGTAAALP